MFYNIKKITTAFALLLVLSFSISSFSILVVSAAEDSWTTKANMPSKRTEFGVAVVDGKIYAIGGHPLGGVTTDINKEYDPATN